MQALWRHIWRRIVEKSQINAANVIMYPLVQALWRDIYLKMKMQMQSYLYIWDLFPTTPLWLLSQWSDSEENLYVKVDAELKWCAAQILGLVQLVGQPSHRHVDAGQDHGDGDGGGDFSDGDLGDFINGDLGENEYLFIVGVFGIRSLGDVSGRDDVRGVFWFVFPATWSSETFDCDGCFDL